LTCDLQFQSPVSHGSDPHTCKRSRPQVSWFEREWKQIDRSDSHYLLY